MDYSKMLLECWAILRKHYSRRSNPTSIMYSFRKLWSANFPDRELDVLNYRERVPLTKESRIQLIRLAESVNLDDLMVLLPSDTSAEVVYYNWKFRDVVYYNHKFREDLHSLRSDEEIASGFE